MESECDMREALIETTDALAKTRRDLEGMQEARRDYEVRIALSRSALRESHEALDNASLALRGPHFHDGSLS